MSRNSGLLVLSTMELRIDPLKSSANIYERETAPGDPEAQGKGLSDGLASPRL